jgi:hypothetical protein
MYSAASTLERSRFAASHSDASRPSASVFFPRAGIHASVSRRRFSPECAASASSRRAFAQSGGPSLIGMVAPPRRAELLAQRSDVR